MLHKIEPSTMFPLRKPLLFSLFPLVLLSLLFYLRPNPTIHHNNNRVIFLTTNPSNPFPPPPRIAYFIVGSHGDVPRILRLLHAIYHPRNQYLLHLDRRASDKEREELVISIGAVEVFVAAENVNVVGKADSVNYEGSTPLALVLHGAAILLKLCTDWDWFVNLDASDYPLVSQDDLIHILSYVPRDSNFIEHNGNLHWNEHQRILQIVVDPGLYLGSRGNMFKGDRKRPVPEAYRLFTGSPHVILSRKLIEFSILGWDNFPRTLLLYFTNTKLSHRAYFQTLVCNSKEFSGTVVNSNLQYTAGDNNLPGKEARTLKVSDLKKMLQSGTAFAGKFLPNDPVLDMIDSLVLHRKQGMVSPGGWCLGKRGKGKDPCQQWGDSNILRPGHAARRIERLLLRLMESTTLHSKQCK